MNKEKIGQEPAFSAFQGEMHSTQIGMSKRFYAACAAMQGMLSSDIIMNTVVDIKTKTLKGFDEIVAQMAYEFADELLKQENQQ